MANRKSDFIEFALAQGVLRFGDFVTKAGRRSPYFFNAGLFSRGAVLARVAQFYADALLGAVQQDRVGFDMLFGPAYKGIVLASATAVALSERGLDVPFAYNRKEVKDHGEGGVVVGAPLKGRVVIVDDVISAGTSVRESVDLIKAAGATPSGVLIAIDRMERSGPDHALSERSAVQELQRTFGLPVVAIATLDDLLGFLDSDSAAARAAQPWRAAVADYRARYGA
ncbi:MAG TPA: orotate phosphoribosyltransferase [Rhizomicrobium sp.]|nr:orotate phosphoribosyltransferase [Rhizomicrobium sp.]